MQARVFHDYIARYIEAIRRMPYDALPRLQPPPFATLSHGAAGTAYALWRLGRPRRAARWLATAVSDRGVDAIIAATEGPSTSYLFGRTGAHWVQARLARGDSRARAVRRYRDATRVRTGWTDFASGAAGLLSGGVLILSDDIAPNTADRELELAVTSLRRSLDARLRHRARRGWHPHDAMQFAHGWSGVAYALLAERERRRAAIPTWLCAALLELVAVWSPTSAPVPTLIASWCNGAAGATLLWSKAFGTTGERRFLTAARQAAQIAERAVGANVDLCCGSGGVAYALLALDRVDAANGWRERAETLAAAGMRGATMRWPNGLHRGHPGLVCLALDCLAEHPRGFPAVEA